MLDQILGPLLSALPATSLIAFYGWYQSDRRAERLTDENRSLTREITTMISHQAGAIQKVTDTLETVTVEIRRLYQ